MINSMIDALVADYNSQLYRIADLIESCPLPQSRGVFWRYFPERHEKHNTPFISSSPSLSLTDFHPDTEYETCYVLTECCALGAICINDDYDKFIPPLDPVANVVRAYPVLALHYEGNYLTKITGSPGIRGALHTVITQLNDGYGTNFSFKRIADIIRGMEASRAMAYYPNFIPQEYIRLSDKENRQ